MMAWPYFSNFEFYFIQFSRRMSRVSALTFLTECSSTSCGIRVCAANLLLKTGRRPSICLICPPNGWQSEFFGQSPLQNCPARKHGRGREGWDGPRTVGVREGGTRTRHAHETRIDAFAEPKSGVNYRCLKDRWIWMLQGLSRAPKPKLSQERSRGNEVNHHLIQLDRDLITILVVERKADFTNSVLRFLRPQVIMTSPNPAQSSVARRF